MMQKRSRFGDFAPFTHSNRNQPRLRYVQPPVREMIKPEISYKRPSIPISSATVYNDSFPQIDKNLAAECRQSAIKPDTSLNIDRNILMEKDTVTKSSYPPLNEPKRPIIVPFNRITTGKGPMQRITTQKHDYCAKRMRTREPFRPNDAMIQSKLPIEDETTMSCSFRRPDGFVPNPSFKPDLQYKKPKIPMESNTSHSLSYLVNKTKPREIPPWARRANFEIPVDPMESETMQKISYPPPGFFVEDYDPIVNSTNSQNFESYPKAASFG